MITEDQTEVIAFLARPSTHGGAVVDRIETHASIVFLAGSRAWKLKRAVRYDYLDFSTAARRRVMCEAEVAVNRRTAPDIYRGVVPVTRDSDGALAMGGQGTPVEWLVEMARFDQDGLLDRQAERGILDVTLMPALGAAIARFHDGASRRPDRGGQSAMAWVVDGNAQGFAEQAAGVFDEATCARVTRASRAAIARDGTRLDARRNAGDVRQCHGDLHLRNIVVLDGRPTLFDAIEFNDDISCIDVLYDLAFLLMDLWHRQLPHHANAVWNGYVAETRRLEGLELLPLFLSCRAAVRAKTSATAANLQHDPAEQYSMQTQAREYLSLAEQLLQPLGPCIVAIGGFSGSGKSTLAHTVAALIGAVPGAIVIRSDVIRKHLCGVDPLHRLGAHGYTAETTHRVYASVIEESRRALHGGQAVIADAVFSRLSDREAIENAANDAGVRFVGLWLDAPEATLVVRSERRERDPSDADADVIRHQLSQGTGAIAWHRIDASSGPEHVRQEAMTILREALAAGVVRHEPSVLPTASKA